MRSSLLAVLALSGCTTPLPIVPTDSAPATDAPALDAVAELDAPSGLDAAAADAPSGDAPVSVDAPLGPFEGCPSGSLLIDADYGDTAIDTGEYGEFGNQIMAIRFTVPAGTAGTNNRLSSWSEYIGGPTSRSAIFSTRACSFDPAHALRTAAGIAIVSPPDAISFSFRYTMGAATTTAAGLTPGGTYYINVRNSFSDGSPSCTIADCRMRGGLPP